MDLTLTKLLVVGTFVTAIVGALGKCPWWVPVILLTITVGLMVFPIK